MIQCGFCQLGWHVNPANYEDCRARNSATPEELRAAGAKARMAYSIPSLPVSRVQHFRAMHMSREA